MTNDQVNALRRRYAELLVKTGVNLQPGQGLLVRGELAHAPFVREVVAASHVVALSQISTGLDPADDTLALNTLPSTNCPCRPTRLPASSSTLTRSGRASAWWATSSPRRSARSTRRRCARGRSSAPRR
ncbi:MAG: aminopeptidase [Caldilinea sp.]|nr:aminopeptidase [Caldilinea sp.]